MRNFLFIRHIDSYFREEERKKDMEQVEMTGNVTVKMARNTIINAKCARLGRIMAGRVRVRARKLTVTV